MPKNNLPTGPKAFQPLSTKPDYWNHLGIPGRGPELFICIRDGIKHTTFEKLILILDTDKKTLSQAINISTTTLYRRARSGHFNPAESDRIYRAAETYRKATYLFQGNYKKAANWFKTTNRGLGGRAPINMLATAAESRAIEDLIGQLEFSVIV